MKLLLFAIGFIVGGMSGITTMCLVQVNRDTEELMRKESTSYEKENKSI